MADSSGKRDPVELLADDFAARCRRGEHPSIDEYAAEYPEHAQQIESLFPSVALMEQLRLDETSRRQAAQHHGRQVDPPRRIGDFDVLREIGRGGMGIVYEAEQRSLRRRVAVKVLPQHAFLLERHVRRFQREAQIAAGLHHTNIVPVFGVGEQDGLHYYVMPLVPGVGLDEIIRELARAADDPEADSSNAAGSCGPVRDVRSVVRSLLESKRAGAHPAHSKPARHRATGLRHENRWHTVAQIGLQAAEALDYAHTQGTLHRDVKPANLLLDAEGVVHVADFGLAHAVDPADGIPSSEVVGTLRYMAPEQLRGAAEARSDVYALGLTLYELLTLRPAFDPANGRSTHSAAEAGRQPPRPRSIVPTVPRDLEAILLKCIHCDPSRRYRTAAALAADLRRFLENRPIRARRVSAVERAWRWCRRNPALAAMSALAASLLVIVGVITLISDMRTRKAYAETRRALTRAEASSHVALAALEDIYLQLSPDRVWISSDSDPGGEACACIGLRSGISSPVERPLTQLQASEKTAALLGNLLVFYDRLAEQVGNDPRVVFESAVASRRVGDIRQRLGQLDSAEDEYHRALRKLVALDGSTAANIEVRVERARNCNEIGNLRSARFDFQEAYRSHQQALDALQPAKKVSAHEAGRLPEEFRYELARTYYFLGSKYSTAFGNRREDQSRGAFEVPSTPPYQGRQYRRSAIRILEELAREFPEAPDYRFLLALCHRPLGIVPEPARGSADSQGRRRALRLLEDLKRDYPQVVDYRYELAATYAWVQVDLFPWQGRSTSAVKAEQGLRKAIAEAEWLVEHNPTIPHYARCKALILAKLGAICRETGRLDEAEKLFANALQSQTALVTTFPNVPSHDRVLVEFFRLCLGRVCGQGSDESNRLDTSRRSGELLQACAENLAELAKKPELADDRLVTTSLRAARDSLRRLRVATVSHEKTAAP